MEQVKCKVSAGRNSDCRGLCLQFQGEMVSNILAGCIKIYLPSGRLTFN